MTFVRAFTLLLEADLDLEAATTKSDSLTTVIMQEQPEVGRLKQRKAYKSIALFKRSSFAATVCSELNAKVHSINHCDLLSLVYFTLLCNGFIICLLANSVNKPKCCCCWKQNQLKLIFGDNTIWSRLCNSIMGPN